MRFFCLFFLVATLVTIVTAIDSPTIKSCITNCPLEDAATAVCGLREISATDFEYSDFASPCALDNANCGSTDPATRYFAISKEGVTCLELANILAPRFNILPVPVVETAVPLSQ